VVGVGLFYYGQDIQKHHTQLLCLMFVSAIHSLHRYNNTVPHTHFLCMHV